GVLGEGGEGRRDDRRGRHEPRIVASGRLVDALDDASSLFHERDVLLSGDPGPALDPHANAGVVVGPAPRQQGGVPRRRLRPAAAPAGAKPPFAFATRMSPSSPSGRSVSKTPARESTDRARSRAFATTASRLASTIDGCGMARRSPRSGTAAGTSTSGSPAST